MRQGQQHRRGRGRNNNQNHHPGNRKGQNPLTRSFESNGPDVKVRGTPAHVAEKYMQLARDAQSSGDHVLAENYLQHAEHYNRIILAYREQQMQQGGEGYSGNGRHHPMSRHESFEGEEGSADDATAGSDDRMSGEAPMYVRQPGAEQPPTADLEGSMDVAPRITQRPNDHHPRFRERHPRHERTERQGFERHDRGGQERPIQDGFEGAPRGERHERSSERSFDRQRERPYRSHEGQGEGGSEMRQPREHREHRHAPRDYPRDAAPRDISMREMPRAPAGEPSAAAPESAPQANGAPSEMAPRPEGAQRRRERFGIGQDQPEFLRRPVRRPRREPEAGFVPEAPTPPAEDSSRE